MHNSLNVIQSSDPLSLTNNIFFCFITDNDGKRLKIFQQASEDNLNLPKFVSHELAENRNDLQFLRLWATVRLQSLVQKSGIRCLTTSQFAILFRSSAGN
jgi:hypothetical protein